MRPGERRVVITLVGKARPIEHHPALVRVEYGAASESGFFLLDPNAPGVTVEDAPLVRKWTTGDVVAGDTSVYMRERDGLWRSNRQGFPTLTDPEVSATTDLGPDGYDVLRYQAGEQ